MPDQQHLQNAAAALAASGLANVARQNMTPERGAQLYFAYFDALVHEENQRKGSAEAGGGDG